jgi:hypothetical protein
LTILDFNFAPRQDEAGKGSIDVDDIRARLHASVKDFVNWLYGGRAFFTKVDARIGNVDGEPGESLSISLRTGLWHDHSTGEGGDLISLYMAWRGYGDVQFLIAIQEIAHDFLGDNITPVASLSRPSPQEKIRQQKEKLGDKPKADQVELGAPVASWVYYNAEGRVEAKVSRYEPDGTSASKTYRPFCFKKNDQGEMQWGMGTPDIRPLYNKPAILAANEVVLVEGEKCAAALIDAGICATTAMQGAKAPVEKTDWVPLAGKRVIIWPDNDKAGKEYARNVAQKLLSLGCRVLGVTPPAEKPSKWDAADCIAEGEDAHAILVGATEVPKDDATSSQARGSIQMLNLDMMKALQRPDFLVHEIITVNGLSMLWGRSGSMKTFAGLDIALSVASGLPWHGKPVKKGLVIYVAAEGAYGVAKRVVGWCSTRGRDSGDPDFLLVPQPIAMKVKAESDALIETILALDRKPSLIVLDTLARTFGDGDENKQSDMNAYVAALDRLRAATGAHVMVVHHSGVHDDKRERGSGVLRGAADTIMKVSRRGEKVDVINQAPGGKQKDFDEFKTVKLRAVKVAYQNAEEELQTVVLNDREDDDEDDVHEGKGEGDDNSTSVKPPRGEAQTKLYEALKKANGLALDAAELKDRTGLSDTTFRKAIKKLVENMLVEQTHDARGRLVWRVSGN